MFCAPPGHAEVHVEREQKPEHRPELTAGRVEELRRLEALERGLAQALTDYARSLTGGGALLHLAARSQRHAVLLAQRISALGGHPHIDPDDLWIVGLADRKQNVIFAVETALRTYHDHLLDFDLDTRVVVRHQILPDHEDTLARLSGESGWVLDAMESS
jgi:hypothetical protein